MITAARCVQVNPRASNAAAIVHERRAMNLDNGGISVVAAKRMEQPGKSFRMSLRFKPLTRGRAGFE